MKLVFEKLNLWPLAAGAGVALLILIGCPDANWQWPVVWFLFTVLVNGINEWYWWRKKKKI